MSSAAHTPRSTLLRTSGRLLLAGLALLPWRPALVADLGYAAGLLDRKSVV